MFSKNRLSLKAELAEAKEAAKAFETEVTKQEEEIQSKIEALKQCF